MPAQRSHLQDKVMGSRVSARAWRYVIVTRGPLAGSRRTAAVTQLRAPHMMNANKLSRFKNIIGARNESRPFAVFEQTFEYKHNIEQINPTLVYRIINTSVYEFYNK
jgi:hypothetical protein